MILKKTMIQNGLSYSKKVKVVGVTFDGRQERLKRVYNSARKRLPLIELVDYEYKGDPAVMVTADGLDIGVLSNKDNEFYQKRKNDILGLDQFDVRKHEEAKASRDGEIICDKKGNPILETSYYVKMYLVVKKTKPDNNTKSQPQTKTAEQHPKGLKGFLNKYFKI